MGERSIERASPEECTGRADEADDCEAAARGAVRHCPEAQQARNPQFQRTAVCRESQRGSGAPGFHQRQCSGVLVCITANAHSDVVAAVLALGPNLNALEINPLLIKGARIEALDVLVSWQA